MSLSSLVDAVVGQVPPTRVADLPAQIPSLLQALEQVPDPRSKFGLRFALPLMLAIAVTAMMVGRVSLTAIGEWSADLPGQVCLAVGLGRRKGPSESAIRHLLSRLDPGALAQAIGAWLAEIAARDLPGEPDRIRHVAVDGKTARGSRDGERAGMHLLAAVDTASGTLLALAPVGAKSSEITAFGPIIEAAGIQTGTVVTADALHTQTGHVAFLDAVGVDWILVLKDNQPGAVAAARSAPWDQIPVQHRQTQTGHGRIETRALQTCEINLAPWFPTAAQVLRVTRRTRRARGAPIHTETAYAITSLRFDQARPGQLADLVRQHWRIEADHHIRDVTLAEDACRARTGTAPAVLAALRALDIARLRIAGSTNNAQTLRTNARHPEHLPPLLKITNKKRTPEPWFEARSGRGEVPLDQIRHPACVAGHGGPRAFRTGLAGRQARFGHERADGLGVDPEPGADYGGVHPPVAVRAIGSLEDRADQ